MKKLLEADQNKANEAHSENHEEMPGRRERKGMLKTGHFSSTEGHFGQVLDNHKGLKVHSHTTQDHGLLYFNYS